MNLFQHGGFTLNSGMQSILKIECDALTREDWRTLALLTSNRIKFSSVVGVPRGGLVFADELMSYCSNESGLPCLIVDDVLTTGGSMAKVRQEIEGPTIGVVVFARGPCPAWIKPIFQMW